MAAPAATAVDAGWAAVRRSALSGVRAGRAIRAGALSADKLAVIELVARWVAEVTAQLPAGQITKLKTLIGTVAGSPAVVTVADAWTRLVVLTAVLKAVKTLLSVVPALEVPIASMSAVLELPRTAARTWSPGPGDSIEAARCDDRAEQEPAQSAKCLAAGGGLHQLSAKLIEPVLHGGLSRSNGSLMAAPSRADLGHVTLKCT